MSEETILAAIAALDGKFTTLDDRFTTLDDRLTALDGRLTTLDGRIATLDGRIATLDGRLTTLDNKFTALDGKFTALDGRITSFRVDVLARFERVENQLTEIRDDISVTMGRADRAHEAAENTRDALRLLSEEVIVLTRKQRRLEARLDEVEKPQGRI